jgi:hypothetical protein
VEPVVTWLATKHWVERVAQRVGPVDAVALAERVGAGIDHDSPDVAYEGRVTRCGKRCYRFALPDERVFYAIVHVERRQFITVIAPGQIIPREGRDPIRTHHHVQWRLK